MEKDTEKVNLNLKIKTFSLETG